MSVEAAYAVCADITRREARNFSYGIRLLPPVKRRALSAVYAVARRIDDIGDGDLPAGQKTVQLGRVRESLRGIRAGITAEAHAAAASGAAAGVLDRHGVIDSADPVLVALADAAGRLPIPLEALEELIDGCQADVDGVQYRTFEDLVVYCRCVAGSVGRMSVGVYNPPKLQRANPLADTLGVALQLTNILRDVCEDRRNGRIYLPGEDLERFGCTMELDADGCLVDPPERFAALIRFEADRAESWYREGLALLPLLDHRSAACTAAMAGIYRRLLARIAADPEPVRSQRLSLSAAGKLQVAARALVRGRA
ncbi:squalene/phytoene synthase family protein [Paeniglutamicibacter antarcticus]|uniref:Squalene/phytoene synthase family protein n=1 Tax=Arthrobacter terrae TaxID=2935737 RepID=A0A931CVF5_9MICC|nr:squalene/phytoene synthase family protein [Arthrobacter terrae]MBG0740618.1 squalene/phytoene synthase family protein [Arthrobacter terrae]